MNTTEAIMSRRSVRKFDPEKPVTKEQIRSMLDAAMHAPSARNSRPWDFVVITKPEDIRKVGSFVGGPQPFPRLWRRCSDPFAAGLGDGDRHLLVWPLPCGKPYGRREGNARPA